MYFTNPSYPFEGPRDELQHTPSCRLLSLLLRNLPLVYACRWYDGIERWGFGGTTARGMVALSASIARTLPFVRRYMSRMVEVAKARNGRPLKPPASPLFALRRWAGRDTVVLATIRPSTCWARHSAYRIASRNGA